jgi:hypothetical protein
VKKQHRWLILSAVIVLILAGLIFLLINLNRGIFLPHEKHAAPVVVVDDHNPEQAILHHLQAAPWQGLHFIPRDKEWRFYGWTGETRRITFSVPFDLIKVYYLEADGRLAYTWVTTGVQIPGENYFSTALSPVHPGQLVAVRLFGKYVGQWGVDWNDCDSQFCHLAALIDTILVLDDEGTGLSNGFIQYGWEPPSSPMYGFLCWSIEPVTGFPNLVISQAN